MLDDRHLPLHKRLSYPERPNDQPGSFLPGGASGRPHRSAVSGGRYRIVHFQYLSNPVSFMEHSSQAINRYIVRIKVRTGFNVTTSEVGRTGLLHRYVSARTPYNEYTHYRIEFDSLKDLIGS
jgi:hypothetical protein